MFPQSSVTCHTKELKTTSLSSWPAVWNLWLCCVDAFNLQHIYLKVASKNVCIYYAFLLCCSWSLLCMLRNLVYISNFLFSWKKVYNGKWLTDGVIGWWWSLKLGINEILCGACFLWRITAGVLSHVCFPMEMWAASSKQRAIFWKFKYL